MITMETATGMANNDKLHIGNKVLLIKVDNLC